VLYNGIGPWWPALDLAELIERFDLSAEKYVPRLRYKLIHEGTYPAEKLEGQESPVADLFRLERSMDWDEIRSGVSRLRQHVGPEEPDLLHAFESWIREVIIPRLDTAPGEIPAQMTLQEVESMLAERIDMWNQKLREESWQKGRQEGRQEGRKEGRQEGRKEGRREGEAKLLLRLLEKRFGPLDRVVRDRIATADADLLLEWVDRFPGAGSLAEIFGD
jgi:hypothetical protein